MMEDGSANNIDVDSNNELLLRRRRRTTRLKNSTVDDENNSSVNDGIMSDLVQHSAAQQQQQNQRQQDSSLVPLSMQLLRPFYLLSYCPSCNSMHNSNNLNIGHGIINGNGHGSDSSSSTSGQNDFFAGNNRKSGGSSENSSTAKNNITIATLPSSNIPTTELEIPPPVVVTIEQILQEYTTYTHTYGCSSRLNAGILTTFRFSLPTLRVSGNFFDADMLALCEVLLRHCNGYLSYIKRLDFTLASKEGRDISMAGNNGRYYGNNMGGGAGGGGGKKGVRSHGAYALSKVLTISQHIEEVYLNGNRIGSYGSSAIFTAASQNTKLRTLLLRGCRIGERGAMSFAHQICAEGSKSGLREVDLSACRIGFRGCYVIEEMLKKKREGMEQDEDGGGGKDDDDLMMVDLEGNLVFQEVMNCVTHGLGILLGTYGTYILNRRISGMPTHYTMSCAIYSASVIVLYTSSTLFHSFFALRQTKFIFCVFDRCAIYLLIAGSYTPFLMISLHHKRIWSLHLLLFIWACAISGILVEACFLNWKHKSIFSLAMYLGMGWSCMVCLPDLVEVLPHNALVLLVAGGLAYTGGVPFFVRNNNLDHSIWHLFVLAGSIFHWLCIFWYVAKPKGMLEG
ncbi:hypothetical protein ACHAXH_002773 [Discostella pseudostelligera]